MKYYDISEDFKLYPDLWCYVVIGGRTTGKTYSALKYCLKKKIKFVFLKRTIEDVKLLCNRGKLGDYDRCEHYNRSCEFASGGELC